MTRRSWIGVTIGLVLTLLVLIGACVAVVVHVLSKRTLVHFQTPRVTGAKVYIGGELIGTAPLTLNLSQLRSRSDPELAGREWPTGYPVEPGMSYGSTSDDNVTHETWAKAADPAGGEDRTLFCIRVTRDSRVVQGAVAIRVVGPGGRTGVLDSCGTSSRSSEFWDEHETRLMFKFPEPEPEAAGK